MGSLRAGKKYPYVEANASVSHFIGDQEEGHPDPQLQFIHDIEKHARMHGSGSAQVMSEIRSPFVEIAKAAAHAYEGGWSANAEVVQL